VHLKYIRNMAGFIPMERLLGTGGLFCNSFLNSFSWTEFVLHTAGVLAVVICIDGVSNNCQFV